MSDDPQAHLPPSMAADYERWLAHKGKKPAAAVPLADDLFAAARADLVSAFEQLPEAVASDGVVGERMRSFRKVCPPEFHCKIQLERLTNRAAFSAVAGWNGRYPGPLASGSTGSGKTRAAWSALGRLCVRENKAFTWFSSARLTESYFHYHMDGEPERFWRTLQRFDVLLMDDLDKVELNPRNATMLFEFADWVYREHVPSIVTTNRAREWWVERMGEAFVRRLFDEGHFFVAF